MIVAHDSHHGHIDCRVYTLIWLMTQNTFIIAQTFSNRDPVLCRLEYVAFAGFIFPKTKGDRGYQLSISVFYSIGTC